MPYEYDADLATIHDGDTVTFHIDLGFDIQSKHPVRIYGINAPELSTPEGKAALEWVAQWFHDHDGPYLLETHKGDEFEKYGRYLAVVVAADGHDLASDIIAAGHAVPYFGGKKT